MEPLFFHLLSLQLIWQLSLQLIFLPSSDCQARPEHPVTLPGGAWAWGRVGDQPKAAAGTTEAAVAAATEAAAAVAEAETIFPVSRDSAAAAPLLASEDAIIELTPASPPAVVTLEGGWWSWGVVATEKSKKLVKPTASTEIV